MRVLITTANHPQSYTLAYLLHGNEILFGEAIEDFPKEDSISLAHELLKICLDLEIEVVFPLRNKEMMPLAESTVLYEEFGIKLMVDQGLEPIFNHQFDQAEDFNQLSASLLRAGYPNSALAIGRADVSGNLLVIDDHQKNFNQVWNKMQSISFSQIGKLFNQQHFEAIAIYQLSENLITAYVLNFNEETVFSAALSAEHQDLIKSKFIGENQEGFYQVDVSGNEILRIKNALL
ncbi:MAG: hypothetical protein ABIP95_15610 [Pelobium sp.]